MASQLLSHMGFRAQKPNNNSTENKNKDHPCNIFGFSRRIMTDHTNRIKTYKKNPLVKPIIKEKKKKNVKTT